MYKAWREGNTAKAEHYSKNSKVFNTLALTVGVMIIGAVLGVLSSLHELA